MNAVRLDSTSKSYGGAAPSVDVDLTIEQGEFFTLLGPSGCGKSTTLRMIAGFVTPTQGRVLFGDRDITHVPAHKRDTGMVFQNYALFPHMSVERNVGYGLTARRIGKEEKKKRIREALRQVGLEGYGERRIDQLSGGQQQRVALARAVVISPSVLLLDEPLSNLDAQLREETRSRIRDVQRNSGITAVYVTHDQAEAMAMSDRIAVLEAGRVHQVGSPREIYQQPATEFVARFIGRSNVLPVDLVRTDGHNPVVRLPGGAELTVAGPRWAKDEARSLGLSVRPEDVRFCDVAEAQLRGTVVGTEFTGATCTHRIAVDDHELLVTAPDGEVDTPEPGRAVGLAVDGMRCWAVAR